MRGMLNVVGVGVGGVGQESLEELSGRPVGVVGLGEVDEDEERLAAKLREALPEASADGFEGLVVVLEMLEALGKPIARASRCSTCLVAECLPGSEYSKGALSNQRGG